MLAGAEAQSADQLNHAVDLYSADYDDSAVSAENIETAYYQQRIGSITSVDDLLKDGRLYNYVLKAFGLDPRLEVQDQAETDLGKRSQQSEQLRQHRA